MGRGETQIAAVKTTHDRETWDAYLQAKRDGLYSETMAWRDVLVAAYGLQDRLFLARAGGEAVGLLCLFVNQSAMSGRHAVSAPLSSIGGGLRGESKDIVADLLRRAESLTKEQRLNYTLLRLNRPVEVRPHWQFYDKYVSFTMPLAGGSERVWSEVLRGKSRNQIRKAERCGYLVDRKSVV